MSGGWATPYIQKLQAGETVQFRPRGNSMLPKIRSGDLCTVEPVAPTQVKTGDVVLCVVKGRQYLHLVHKMSDGGGLRFQIGNNRGFINGWVGGGAIFGRLVRVDP